MPQAFALAIIAGYADTAGFLRFDAFAGMMTGNTVLFSIALLHHEPLAAAAYAGIIACFFIGAVLAQLLLQLGRPIWIALSLEGALLLSCDFFHSSWAVILLVLAMGMQSTAATQFGRVRLNTVFITGNIQRFAEGLVRRHLPARTGASPHSEEIAIYGLVWLGYALGAGGGAAGHAFLAWPLIVPAALLPFIYWRGRKS
jgi:uncharacterized membrane protein YoaK (UPF0700 family)